MLHTKFMAIGLVVLEKKIFEGFSPYMVMEAPLIMWPYLLEYIFISFLPWVFKWNLLQKKKKKKKKKKSHFFTFSNWKTYWTKFIFCLVEAIYIQKSCIKQQHWLNIVNRYLHGCNSVKVSTMFHCFPIVIPKWRNLTLE